MSYLDDITQAEKQAKKTIEAAKDTKQRELAAAQATAREELDAYTRELAEQKRAAHEAQKQELAERYRTIIKEADREVEALQTRAASHKKEAVDRIVASLTSSAHSENN